MEIKKTDAEAEAFAANLAYEGDAGVFRNLWARGEHGMIRGHFPAFVADESTEVSPAPTRSEAVRGYPGESPAVVTPAKSTTKSKK